MKDPFNVNQKLSCDISICRAYTLIVIRSLSPSRGDKLLLSFIDSICIMLTRIKTLGYTQPFKYEVHSITCAAVALSCTMSHLLHYE